MTKQTPPNVLLPDKAILVATEEELEERSPWYTDGKYTFRYLSKSSCTT